MVTRAPGVRLVLIAPAGILLLLGMYSGLLLLGVHVPSLSERLATLHAPLMIFGFVGTLISLERAVALRAGWAYLAPVLLALGSVLALSPAPLVLGTSLVLAGLVLHLLQYAAIWRRQPMTATAIQALGVVAAVIAGLLWVVGVAVPLLVPSLAVFLVLTIVGERLELARVAAPGLAAERVLFALAVALASAALLSVTLPLVAVPLAGIALLAIVAWLWRYDIARVMVRRSGLPRYVALCLLLGYGWLAVAGAGWLLGGPRTEGVIYDATTHAVFLGFVFTMIMAHAPLILPAVLQLSIPYHRSLYVPVAVLHLGLLVRVVAGDAWGVLWALQAGGILSIVAILIFAVTVVTLTVRGRRAPRKGSPHVAA